MEFKTAEQIKALTDDELSTYTSALTRDKLEREAVELSTVQAKANEEKIDVKIENSDDDQPITQISQKIEDEALKIYETKTQAIIDTKK